VPRGNSALARRGLAMTIFPRTGSQAVLDRITQQVTDHCVARVSLHHTAGSGSSTSTAMFRSASWSFQFEQHVLHHDRQLDVGRLQVDVARAGQRHHVVEKPLRFFQAGFKRATRR